MPSSLIRLLLGASVALLLAACGGSKPDEPPTAQGVALGGDEDRAVPLSLAGKDPEGKPIRFRIVREPRFGSVTVSATTGIGEYVPNRDFNGSDSFSFTVSTPNGMASTPAEVSLSIAPVNDAPAIQAPSKATNSAYTYESPIDIAVFDVDGDTTDYTVSIEPADVAEMTLDRAMSRLILKPLRRGAATIALRATDGTLDSEASIAFEVTDVRRDERLRSEQPQTRAVTIRNPRNEMLEFRLEHNGFRSYASLAEVAEHVRELPAAYADEPFGSKLWRFIRDNVAHDYPPSQKQWIYDPLVTLNSLGWGLCSNVSSLYVRIARAAGYEARVWGLGGHVVPELFADGRWQMFDPDLAVVYFNRDRLPAGVAELVADPELIRAPVDAVHDVHAYNLPYNALVADIYATTQDNVVETWYDGPDQPLDGTVRLPAGASLTYPGVWHDAPVGYDSGATHAVANFRHAVLDLPASHRGPVALPWLLVSIQGTGRVRLSGKDYPLGDPALLKVLRDPVAVHHTLEVLETSGELRLVFLVNAVRHDMTPETEVAVTGLDVWALEIDTVELDAENRLPATVAPPLVKPKSRLEI